MGMMAYNFISNNNHMVLVERVFQFYSQGNHIHADNMVISSILMQYGIKNTTITSNLEIKKTFNPQAEEILKEKKVEIG